MLDLEVKEHHGGRASGVAPHGFRENLIDAQRFVITLELVPGPESHGRSVDTIKAIAEDARKDGRVSAVSITDNPGGNPSLSPDALGREILDQGMDVIVHCTCRDLNRAGLESRALQLSRMGLKNILALTGDYAGSGFAGQAQPVFDLDSVTLICLLHALNVRAGGAGDRSNPPAHGGFCVGCAVSPFKWTEAECFAQYAKLRLKRAVCADFVMTQLGYDARKFQELLQVQRLMKMEVPTFGTVFLLTPGAARAMNRGHVPGAAVTDELLQRVTGAQDGKDAAIEGAARLAAVLKGLGYRGIHLGGVHRSFDAVERILNRIETVQEEWREFLPDFNWGRPDGFYVFERDPGGPLSSNRLSPRTSRCGFFERLLARMLRGVHDGFFRFGSPAAKPCERLAAFLDRSRLGRGVTMLVEDVTKSVLFSCERCGDCALQDVGFLCPESQCPKHMRNGACGGSDAGRCEAEPKRPCVWVRCYNRLAAVGQAERMNATCVPPRMWELNGTPSWLNFHLRRDHQSPSCAIARQFGLKPCPARKSSADGGEPA